MEGFLYALPRCRLSQEINLIWLVLPRLHILVLLEILLKRFAMIKINLHCCLNIGLCKVRDVSKFMTHEPFFLNLAINWRFPVLCLFPGSFKMLTEKIFKLWLLCNRCHINVRVGKIVFLNFLFFLNPRSTTGLSSGNPQRVAQTINSFALCHVKERIVVGGWHRPWVQLILHFYGARVALLEPIFVITHKQVIFRVKHSVFAV